MARGRLTLERLHRYARRQLWEWYGRTLAPSASPLRRRRILSGRGLRLHLGSGDDRLPGWINIDQRYTSGTDLTMNLSRPRLRPGSVAACFSHAFFEHLFVRDRIPHLERVREALEPGGFVCYLGLPDFEAVARFYLEKRAGIYGPVFDLFNAYRYTHGDPEQVPWFLGQLHKGLFDYPEVVRLLTASGFESFTVFSACYPGEELPVTLGFYAVNARMTQEALQEACSRFLAGFDGFKVRAETVRFLPAGQPSDGPPRG